MLLPYLPLITTLVTLFAGLFIFTIQTRKNRILKWIDEFRKEITEFIARVTLYEVGKGPFSKEDYFKVLYGISSIRLYLDMRNKSHNELYNELESFMEDVEYNHIHDGLQDRLSHILKSAERIIREEQAKVDRWYA